MVLDDPMRRAERQPDWPSLRRRSEFFTCPVAPKDVRAEEAHARRRIGKRLSLERKASFAFYNVVRPVLDSVMMTAKLASWRYTDGMTLQRIVGARLIRDYRCSMESLFAGYMVQAATFTADTTGRRTQRAAGTSSETMARAPKGR